MKRVVGGGIIAVAVAIGMFLGQFGLNFGTGDSESVAVPESTAEVERTSQTQTDPQPLEVPDSNQDIFSISILRNSISVNGTTVSPAEAVQQAREANKAGARIVINKHEDAGSFYSTEVRERLTESSIPFEERWKE